MNFPTLKFWHFTYPSSLNEFADWDDGVRMTQVICPVAKGHKRGGARIGPLNVVLPRIDVDDVTWVWGSDCLLDDRTRVLFEGAKFTGYNLLPASARFKRGSDVPPCLWEFQTTGWAGLAPPASGIRLIPEKCCSVCGKLRYSGLHDPTKLIDISQWDGSDFFMIWPLPKFIFVSERVKALVDHEELTGVELTPMESLKPSEGCGPGRLHYWMPDDRAHELGDPLGIY